MRISRVSMAANLLPMVFASSVSWAQSPSANAPTTPAQFSVSQSGAANYRTPIQVPPGVAGMAPKLELVYNSQRGNGMFGLGWGLAGLSSITRCAQTTGQDGSKGAVRFDANDRLCLDGQRLMLVSGTYGAAGSEYRTEIDSFSKIIANGTAGSGPASFTVKTKSGLTLEYGNTTDSLIEAVKSADSTANWPTGTAWAWAQNKVTDLSGNYLTISYSEDMTNGAYYPARIDYTGNATSSPVLTPVASVRFESDLALTRLDAVRGYQTGAQFKATQRIDFVRTYLGTTKVKEYRLAYGAQTTALDRSKLVSVIECDGATTPTCLPPTNLAWGSAGTDAFATATTALANQYGTAQGWSYNSVYPRRLVDVNGDGLADIVGFASGGAYVALNTGGGNFAAPGYWLQTQFGTSHGWSDNNVFPRQLADVNGDGLPDIVGFGPNGVMVSLNTGGAFAAATTALASQFSPTQGWTNNDTHPRQLVDVNGDGLPDIVGFDASGVFVSLNTGGGNFGTPAYWLQGQFGVNQGWTDSNITPRSLVDVNGDGLPDIVGFARGGVYVTLNTGSGFAAPGMSCSSGSVSGFSCGTSYAATPVYVCPVGWAWSMYDGGGAVCVAPWGGHEGTYAPPTLSGYSCPSGGSLYGTTCTTITATVPTLTCPSGYTASGSSCILTGGTGVPTTWQLSDFGVVQGWTDSKVAPRTLVDVNGDGLPDIVGFGPNGVMVALNVGTGFAPATNWLASQYGVAQGWIDNNVTPRLLADVNGDGLPDIVGFSPNGVMVSLNTGASFNSPVNWNANFGSAAGGWSDNNTFPRYLVDVNGDGLPDIVGFSSASVMVANNTRSMGASYVASVTDSLGAVTTPTYSALPTNDIYTRDTAANAATFPQMDVAAPFYVVSSVARSNGIGGTNTMSYTYGGLKAEVGSGRGMLGFRWVKSQEQSTGLQQYTEYRQDWPYTGQPTLNETRLSGAGNAGVLRRTVVTPACQIPKTLAACAVAAGASYFPYAASTVESGWTINGTSLPVSTTNYTYGQSPQFGDPTRIVVSTDDGVSKTTVNSFTPADTANWIAPRLQQSSVTSVKP